MRGFVGYLAVGLIHLLGLLNLRGAQRLGRFIGWLLWVRPTRAKAVAQVNVNLCFPDWSESQRTELVKATLCHNGMTVAETGAAWGWSPAKGTALLAGIEGESIMLEAVNASTGTLFIPVHQGNWELFNHSLSGYGDRAGMYRPSKMPAFDRYMRESRARMGLGVMPTTRQGVESLFEVLGRGGIAITFSDQEPKLARGEFSSFLGVPTLTPKLPYELIQKTGCKVVFGYEERLDDARGLKTHFIKPDDDIYSMDVDVHLKAMNRTLEACIKPNLEQYQWSYKRFKRRPDGRDIYADCP